MDEKKGDKAFKKAKEEITISVFNWSKDYASAASNFDEACTHIVMQSRSTSPVGPTRRQLRL